MKKNFKVLFLAIISFGLLAISTSRIQAASYEYSVNFSGQWVSGHSNGVYRPFNGLTRLTAKYRLEYSTAAPTDFNKDISVELKYKCGIGNWSTCTFSEAQKIATVSLKKGNKIGSYVSGNLSWNVPGNRSYYFVSYNSWTGNHLLQTTGTGTVTSN